MSVSQVVGQQPQWTLLADQSASLRGLLRRSLTDAGVRGEIVEVATASEALHELDTRQAPQLVVLDAHLQGPAGPDLAPAVRSRCPDTYLALLDGLASTGGGDLGPEQPADLHLAKRRGLARCRAALLSGWRAQGQLAS